MVLFPDQSQVSLRTPEYAKAVDSVCLILLLICSIIKDKKESIFCYFFSLKLTYIFSPSEGALPVGRKREGFVLLLKMAVLAGCAETRFSPVGRAGWWWGANGTPNL